MQTDEKLACKERVATLASELKGWERKLLKDTIEEHAGSIQYWQWKMAERLLSRHLVFKDRFQLTLFMLQNKIPPVLIAQWMIKRKMLRDQSARMMVAGVIKSHMEGKLEDLGIIAQMLDATDGAGNPLPLPATYFPVFTPNFAHDWQHQHFWEEAIEMLKQNAVPVEPIPPNRQNAKRNRDECGDGTRGESSNTQDGGEGSNTRAVKRFKGGPAAPAA